MIDFLDIAIFLFLTAAAFIILLLVSVARRPKVIQRKLERDPLKIKIEKKNGLQGTTDKLDRWFTQLLRRANIRIDRITVLLLIICAGMTATATAFVFELPDIIALVIGSGIVLLGLGIYYVLMLRRLQMFNKQFPAGLELMARATRAGESLEQAFELSKQSSEQPLKGEFKYCQRQLQLGMSIEDVSEDLASRIGSVDLKLFAHTIAIHRMIGGRLADSLERLSLIVRRRGECNEKMKSMTSLGRFAVIAIVAMGGLVLTYMSIMQPEYIGRLTQSDLGKKLIIYAAVSELIGLAWVAWTLKTDV